MHLNYKTTHCKYENTTFGVFIQGLESTWRKVRKEGNQQVSGVTTGRPRPIVNPRVPSGIRGPGGGFEGST